jgi:hypothetical protein
MDRDLGYAITGTYKAQGSDFGGVVVIVSARRGRGSSPGNFFIPHSHDSDVGSTSSYGVEKGELRALLQGGLWRDHRITYAGNFAIWHSDGPKRP